MLLAQEPSSWNRVEPSGRLFESCRGHHPFLTKQALSVRPRDRRSLRGLRGERRNGPSLRSSRGCQETISRGHFLRPLCCVFRSVRRPMLLVVLNACVTETVSPWYSGASLTAELRR